jgi:hypothetical protein
VVIGKILHLQEHIHEGEEIGADFPETRAIEPKVVKLEAANIRQRLALRMSGS